MGFQNLSVDSPGVPTGYRDAFHVGLSDFEYGVLQKRQAKGGVLIWAFLFFGFFFLCNVVGKWGLRNEGPASRIFREGVTSLYL